MSSASAAAISKKSTRGGISADSDVVFVGCIPRQTTQCDLKDYLQEAVGAVKKVRFVIDPRTRHHRGYGFARFESAAAAAEALRLGSTKKGFVFRGKRLNIGVSNHTMKDDDEVTVRSESVTAAGTEEEEEDDFSDLPELEDDECDESISHEEAASSSSPASSLVSPADGSLENAESVAALLAKHALLSQQIQAAQTGLAVSQVGLVASMYQAPVLPVFPQYNLAAADPFATQLLLAQMQMPTSC
eukprot:TRINITY_DN5445_c0_g1_i1.p1 TRINITY_DN5445_c0_g1~~TRINITY_DN5445_c0_g1_i1.p1  ORF type:complete len:245 (+),score=101.04 TRINITY_DN5445_c0_g1_i1:73-807(+)